MNKQPSKGRTSMRLLAAIIFAMIAVGGIIIYLNQAHNEYRKGMAAYEAFDYSSANEHLQSVIGFYKLASATNVTRAQQLISTEIHVMLDAEDKIKHGNYESAVEDYKTFTTSYPESPHTEFVKAQIAKTYLEWGDDLIQHEKFEDAIKQYVIISSEYKGQPITDSATKKLVEAYMKWGDALVQTGDYEGAIEKYKILLSEDKIPSAVQPATTHIATAFLKWGDALAQSADYQGSIEKYRVVLHDYKDQPIAQTALKNLVVAYDNLGRQFIEEKSFSAAMDTYILANAFSTDSAMQAKFQTAYKTAFAELLKDTGADGQSVMDEALKKACEGKPGKSPVLGMSSDTLLGVRLCKSTEGVQLPEEWIAKTPGNLRFVVDIHSRETQFASCSYTGGGTVPRRGQAKEINIYDVRTGKRVDQKIYYGQDPAPCPSQLFSSDAPGNSLSLFPSGATIDSITGGPVTVSDQEIQNDLIRLLKPLVSTPVEASTAQVIPDIPILPKGLLLPVSNTQLEIDDEVNRVLFSPDGKLLATTTENHTVLWNVESGKKVRVLEPNGTTSKDLAFTPDGKMLAITDSPNSTIGFWNITSGEKVLTLDGLFGVMALSPDGKLLASVGSGDAASEAVKIWNIANATEVHRLEESSTSYVRCIAFSPDGKLLAVGLSGGNLINVWDVETGNKVWEQKNPPQSYDSSFPGEIRGIAFSPDGKLLAAGLGEGMINLWDASSGKLIHTLTGHSDSVLSVAFSPNGKLLASGSADNTIKFWDISNGNEVYSFDFSGYDTDAGLDAVIGNHSLVYSVAFSPDGKWLATGRFTSVVIIDSRGTYPNVLHLWKLEDQFFP